MAAARYLAIVNGERTEVAAVQTGGSGNADKIPALNAATGLLDISMMPTGIGPDTVSVVASETLSAGAFVNIYNNAGTPNVRNADASSGLTKRAHGFVLSGYASSATALVYLGGLNTGAAAPSGLAVVGQAFLNTVGGSTGTAPTTATYIVQMLGLYIPSTGIQFSYTNPVTRV